MDIYNYSPILNTDNKIAHQIIFQLHKPGGAEAENGEKSKYKSDPLDFSSPSSSAPSSRDSSPLSSDSDSYRPTRKSGPVARASFTTALLRAGTKSTKDSSLDKSKAAAVKEEVKPVARKVPGQLLQSAGVGLLNFNRKERSEEDDIFKPASSCISFGLYGGHLSVDRDTSSQTSLGCNDRPFMSLLTKEKPQESTKRVFSNWGGEFFKKNLDYRANTNKIMEKMQLAKAGPDLGANVTDINASSEL